MNGGTQYSVASTRFSIPSSPQVGGEFPCELGSLATAAKIKSAATPGAGEMAEWLKAHAWKACIRETVSRVRIPLSPPFSSPEVPRSARDFGSRLSLRSRLLNASSSNPSLSARTLISATSKPNQKPATKIDGQFAARKLISRFRSAHLR
jgi:hypothetical protein